MNNKKVIKKFIEDGKLVKETKVLFSLADEFTDKYVLLQKKREKMVFSYGTALYLCRMSDRVYHNIYMTVPQGFNSIRITKDNTKKFIMHKRKYGI